MSVLRQELFDNKKSTDTLQVKNILKRPRIFHFLISLQILLCFIGKKETFPVFG